MSISTLIDALADGGELRIDALGRLWIEKKVARRVASNLAGKRQVYAREYRWVVRFRASRRLVAAMNDWRVGEKPEHGLGRDFNGAKDARESRERVAVGE